MFRSPFLIAGPCVLEDGETNLRIAQTLVQRSKDWGIPIIFKASFDKANRSSVDSARGPGLDEGLRELERIKDATGLQILTDIHEVSQAKPVAEVVDVIQIPAFLSRQTDLLIAAGSTGKAVNVKKGQWMDAAAAARAVGKVRSGGAKTVALTERGTFFGYGDLVVDMRSFERMKKAANAPVIFDVTHSIQQPGQGPDGRSGGDRDAAPALARAAVAAGADGLFIETHPDPAIASSDADSIWELSRLGELVEPCLRIWNACG